MLNNEIRLKSREPEGTLCNTLVKGVDGNQLKPTEAMREADRWWQGKKNRNEEVEDEIDAKREGW